jgi:hypothetical protein
VTGTITSKFLFTLKQRFFEVMASVTEIREDADGAANNKLEQQSKAGIL